MTTNQTDSYASFGRRAAALIIDIIFLNVVTVPLSLAVYGTEYLTDPNLVKGPADFMISWLLPAVIVIAFWITLAATPGKLALGIRVLDAESGQRLNIAQSVIRYFGYIISALPLLLGYFWMLRQPRRQTWHDRLAKSVVIRHGKGREELAVS